MLDGWEGSIIADPTLIATFAEEMMINNGIQVGFGHIFVFFKVKILVFVEYCMSFVKARFFFFGGGHGVNSSFF